MRKPALVTNLTIAALPLALLAGCLAALSEASATPASDGGGTMSKQPAPEALAKLTPLQFQVTQRSGTERPFDNAYWDNHAPGIYVDVVSGEVLFSSIDKFDSGTGWPSFTRPLAPENVKENRDATHGMVRVEVRSAGANSHLGHLFDDGPAPTGQRYCMNSASMRFVPADQLAAQGYGAYAKLFDGGQKK